MRTVRRVFFLGMHFSGFDDGSSSAFPRLAVCELHAFGNAPRCTERLVSPDLSSFSSTGFKPAAMLALR